MRFEAAFALLVLASASGCAGPAAGGPSTLVPAAELRWAPQAPGLPQQLTTLWGDRAVGPSGVLVKLPSAFDSGLHAHTAEYRAVVVSGTLIHVDENGAGADRELTAGSYLVQPGGSMHIDRCKEGAECILFIYQEQKADVIWPRK